jgi:phage-related tail protein
MGKRMELAVLTLVLALSLVGCDKSGPEPTDANQTASGKLKQDAGDALQAAADLAAREKARALRASEEQLAKLEEQFRQWAGEVPIEDAQAKAALDQLGSVFQGALDNAQEALKAASGASVDAWKEAGPGLETAVRSAQNAYDAFVAHIKSQAQREEQKDDNPEID